MLRLLASEAQAAHEASIQLDASGVAVFAGVHVNFLARMQRVLLEYVGKSEGMRLVLDQDVERGIGHEAAVARAQAGVHEVLVGYGGESFAGCPLAWSDKPFAKISFHTDQSDPDLGFLPEFGWILAEDQTGTVVADLAAVPADAPR